RRPLLWARFSAGRAPLHAPQPVSSAAPGSGYGLSEAGAGLPSIGGSNRGQLDQALDGPGGLRGPVGQPAASKVWRLRGTNRAALVLVPGAPALGPAGLSAGGLLP